jgi:hypothetical protein
VVGYVEFKCSCDSFIYEDDGCCIIVGGSARLMTSLLYMWEILVAGGLWANWDSWAKGETVHEEWGAFKLWKFIVTGILSQTRFVRGVSNGWLGLFVCTYSAC